MYEHTSLSHASSATVEKISIDLAHVVYNHASQPVLEKLLPHLRGQKLSFCEACALNLKNKPYSKSEDTKYKKDNIQTYVPHRYISQSQDLQLAELNLAVNTEPRRKPPHKVSDKNLPLSDIAVDGFTSPTTSVRNMKYAYVLVDTVTKMCYTFLVQTKDEFKTEYIRWAKHIYNKTGRFPAYVRVDQAGELTSGDVMEFFGDCGTVPTSSTTKQSNQNAFAERLIGILWNKTKTVLTQCGLPMTYWCYAFAYVSIVYNHLPHRALNSKRPVDVAGVLPVDSFLHPLGCEGFYYKPVGNKSELTGHRCVSLGFDNFKKGYAVLDLETKQAVSSRTVMFRWNSFPFLYANKGIPLPLDIVTWPKLGQL